MTDLRQWSREFFVEFIDIYKEHPCLWKIKTKDYSDRDKKGIAYEALIAKCKEIDISANKEYVTKKINSFRTVYRKELKKVRDSERSGAGSDDVYVPTLWYFKLLAFLADQETPRQSQNSMHDTGREVRKYIVVVVLDLNLNYDREGMKYNNIDIINTFILQPK